MRAATRLPRVAVIGAGIAGLICARLLTAHRRAVTILDKGRAPGGRISTRREDGISFDHGAQYFTARHRRFRRIVQRWRSDGL
jgi:predicted NAD/FAD-dependent oxidoreductase